ncbi:unnamed protein product [Vicia faba]|uniref:Uncharacterized protein n=1 Tax=Vicia faba TaxID=3906 RepID=A0AAV1B5Q2_VICFA|nr:unnamed protein product [Vicia faba]
MKRNKNVSRIGENDVEDHENDIMVDIEDEEKWVDQTGTQAKLSIRENKLPKNIPSAPVDNFNYKLFVRKHVDGFVIHTIADIDETDLGIDEDMLEVAHFSRFVRSHILKALIHEAKMVQEIIDTFTTKKSVYK